MAALVHVRGRQQPLALRVLERVDDQFSDVSSNSIPHCFGHMLRPVC